ncbi:hypothetical protein D3C81_1348830 [compost metagenome]
MQVRGENNDVRRRPLSITTVTPSTVRLDSAIDVASTTLRRPAGAGSIARRCSACGSAPYSGASMTSAGNPPPASSDSARRISRAPGRNTSTLPSCAVKDRRTARSTVRSSDSLGVPGAYTVSTGNIRPRLCTTGAPSSKSAIGPGSSVADMTSSRKSSRSNWRLCQANASPRSACKLRS